MYIKKSNNTLDDKLLLDKLLKLIVVQEIEESNCYINIISNKIKFYETEKTNI